MNEPGKESATPEWVEQEKQTILRFLARDKLLSTSMAFHCFVTFREGPHYTG